MTVTFGEVKDYEVKPVETFEDAREQSLAKWSEVKETLTGFIDLWDRVCGFCRLAKKESNTSIPIACKYCKVETKCHEVRAKMVELTQVYEYVTDLTDWVKELKED